MSVHVTSKRRANTISNGVLLIGLGILFVTNYWWPGILLVVGASVGFRQYLRARFLDLLWTAVIFGGLFIVFFLDGNVGWDMVLAVAFMIGGVYLIFREYFLPKPEFGDELAEDVSVEVSEEEKDED